MSKIPFTRTIGPALFGVLALIAGCSSVQEPTGKNFLAALNSYYADRQQCLFHNTLSFPYETAIRDETSTGSKGLDALTASSLMKRQQGKLVGINRYTLTPAGEQAGGRFCYGHIEATAIASFTPPVIEGGRQTTTVTYKYKLKDLPVWADTDAVKDAFPELKKQTAPDPEDAMKLVLLPTGWAVGLDTLPLNPAPSKN